MKRAMSFKSQPILSRKLALNSFSRHFAKWKIREFTLHETDGLLEVLSGRYKRSVINLKSYQAAMGLHYYAPELPTIWIQYFDNAQSSMAEIVMRFSDRDELARWETVSPLSTSLNLFESCIGYCVGTEEN